MKRLLKILLGFPLSLIFFRLPLLNRYGNYLISTLHNTNNMSRLDHFLYPAICYSWINYIYLREQDPDKREALKSIAMVGRIWGKLGKAI